MPKKVSCRFVIIHALIFLPLIQSAGWAQNASSKPSQIKSDIPVWEIPLAQGKNDEARVNLIARELATINEILRIIGDTAERDIVSDRIIQPQEQQLLKFLNDILGVQPELKTLRDVKREDFVKRGKQVVDDLEGLRKTAEAVYQISRTTEIPGQNPSSLEQFRQVTGNRIFDTLESLGRSWVRLWMNEVANLERDQSPIVSDRELTDRLKKIAKSTKKEEANIIIKELDFLLAQPEVILLRERIKDQPAELRDILDQILNPTTKDNFERLQNLSRFAGIFDPFVANRFRELINSISQNDAERRKVKDVLSRAGKDVSIDDLNRLAKHWTVRIEEIQKRIKEIQNTPQTSGAQVGALSTGLDASGELQQYVSFLVAEFFSYRQIFANLSRSIQPQSGVSPDSIKLDPGSLEKPLGELHDQISKIISQGPLPSTNNLKQEAVPQYVVRELLQGLRVETLKSFLTKLSAESNSPGQNQGKLDDQLFQKLIRSLDISDPKMITPQDLPQISAQAKLAWRALTAAKMLLQGFEGVAPQNYEPSKIPFTFAFRATDLKQNGLKLSFNLEVGALATAAAPQQQQQQPSDSRIQLPVLIPTGLSFKEIAIEIPEVTNYEQFQLQFREGLSGVLKEKEASPSSTPSSTEDLNRFIRGLGFPQQLQANQAKLRLKEGISFNILDQCVRVQVTPDSTDPNGQCLNILANEIGISRKINEFLKESILKRYRSKITEEIIKLAADLHFKDMPGAPSNPESFLEQSLKDAPITYENGEAICRLELRNLGWISSSSTLVIKIKLDGKVIKLDGNGSIHFERSLSVNDDLTSIISDQQILYVKSVREGLYNLELGLRDGIRDMGRLGWARIKDSAIEFDAPDASADLIDIGGGFKLKFQDLKWSRGIIFEGAILQTPSPFESQQKINVKAVMAGGKFVWSLGYKDQDELKNMVLRSLRRQELIPPNVGVKLIELGRDGLLLEWEVNDEALKRQMSELFGRVNDQFYNSLAKKQRLLSEYKKGLINLQSSANKELGKLLQFLEGGLRKETLNKLALQSMGSISLGDSQIIFYDCRGGDTRRYGICTIELKFDFLSCDYPTLNVRSLNGIPRYQFDPTKIKPCLREWVRSSLGVSTFKLTAYTYNRQKKQVEAQISIMVEGRPFGFVVGLGLDGHIYIDHNIITRIAGEIAKASIKNEIRKKYPEVTWANNLRETIEGILKEKEQEWQVVIKSEIPPRPDTTSMVVCEIKYLGGPEELTMNNVHFSLQSGFDFSEATFDTVAINNFAQKLLPNSQFLKVKLISDTKSKQWVDLLFNAVLNIDVLDKPLGINFHLKIGEEKLVADFSTHVLDPLVAVVNSTLKDVEISEPRIALKITGAQHDNVDLIISGQVIISRKPSISPDVVIRIPIARQGSIRVIFNYNRGWILSILQPVLIQIASQVGIPLFKNIKITDGIGVEPIEPSFVDKDGKPFSEAAQEKIPYGVSLGLKVTLFDELTIKIPKDAILIDLNGVRLGRFSDIEVKVPLNLPIPPFKLVEAHGRLIDMKEIRLTGRFTLLEPEKSECVIYLDGEYIFNIDYPYGWKTNSDLILFTTVNIGRNSSDIDLRKGSFKQVIDLGGRLSNILNVQGELTINASARQVSGEVKGSILKQSIANGDIKIVLGPPEISFEGKLNFKFSPVALSARFNTKENFSNPTVTAGGKMNIGAFELSNIYLQASPEVAHIGFDVLWMHLELGAPSLDDITPKKLLDLILENLFSLDPKDLPQALLQILSGNLRINPFSSFGPNKGGVANTNGRNGDKGLNESNAGEQGSKGDRTGRSEGFGSIQRALAKGEGGGAFDKSKPAGLEHRLPNNGEIQGQGSRGIFMDPGDYYFPIRSAGTDLAVYKYHKDNSPDQADLMALLDEKFEDGTVQFRKQNAQSYSSAGMRLLQGDDYFIHALRQGLVGDKRSDPATIYWFKGKTPDSKGQARFPLASLNIGFDQIRTLQNNAPILAKAFKKFLLGTVSYIKPGATAQLIEDAFILSGKDSQGAIEGICVRYSQEESYSVFVAEERSEESVEIAFVIAADLLKPRQSDDKEFVAAFLRKLAEHANEIKKVYIVGGQRFLYLPDELLRWDIKKKAFESELDFNSPSNSIIPAPFRSRSEADLDKQSEYLKKQAVQDAINLALKEPLFKGNCKIRVEEDPDPEFVHISGEDMRDGSTCFQKTKVAIKIDGREQFIKQNGIWRPAGTPIKFGHIAYIQAVESNMIYWLLDDDFPVTYGKFDLLNIGLNFGELVNTISTNKKLETLFKMFLEYSEISEINDDHLTDISFRFWMNDIEAITVQYKDDDMGEFVVFVTDDKLIPWSCYLFGLEDLLEKGKLLAHEQDFYSKLLRYLLDVKTLAAEIFVVDNEKFVLIEGNLLQWKDGQLITLGKVTNGAGGPYLRIWITPSKFQEFFKGDFLRMILKDIGDTTVPVIEDAFAIVSDEDENKPDIIYIKYKNQIGYKEYKIVK